MCMLVRVWILVRYCASCRLGRQCVQAHYSLCQSVHAVYGGVYMGGATSWFAGLALSIEYLDISPQGLTWRLLSNHAPSKWQQKLRPQFRLDKHSISWPQLKNVQVLADGNSDHPITYLWLTAIETQTGELLHLRINETHTNYTSKQLRQLLLQYHNLGMKPFHTVGKKAT